MKCTQHQQNSAASDLMTGQLQVNQLGVKNTVRRRCST